MFLSKSKFLEGLSCPKLLWYEFNRPAQIAPDDAERLEIIKQGKIVGEHAQRLYPGGSKIEWSDDPRKMHERSIAALKERRPLFEAGFVHGETYAQADILLPVENDAWDLIEVKSTTMVKDDHLYDAAFQKYVYQGAGIKLRNCYLMHLNTKYVRSGALELEKLFVKVEVNELVGQLLPKMESKVAEMLEMLKGPGPDIKVGRQCQADCPLHDYCWQFLPEQHVFILRGKKDAAFDLLERGILQMKDIPKDYELNESHTIQMESHNSGQPFVDIDSLNIFLEKLEYPLYFLDFETIAPAIPVYDLTRPYEDIVFQYSLHVVEKEGSKPLHYSYLAPGDVDPRPEVIKQLVKLLGKSGSIIAYFAQYEKQCIKSMVNNFPEYAPWFEETVNRFVDLLIPFKRMFYYSPKQQGSASMKKVLPALTGLSYADLVIGNGGAARFEFMRVTFEKGVDPDDRQRVRDALEKYCELDTLGMVKILEALKKATIGIHHAD